MRMRCISYIESHKTDASRILLNFLKIFARYLTEVPLDSLFKRLKRDYDDDLRIRLPLVHIKMVKFAKINYVEMLL